MVIDTHNMGSWKTTIAGLAGAILTVVVQYTQNNHKFDWHQLSIPVTIAVLGFLAKDSNVTGGTTLQSNAVPDATLHAEAKAEEVLIGKP